MPMRFLGGPSRTEIKNILVRDSLWDDIFYLFYLFQYTSGIRTDVAGTSSITISDGHLEDHTGAGINSTIHSILLMRNSAVFSFDKIRRFRTLVDLNDNANQTFYVLTGRRTDVLLDAGAYPYFGFKIVNNQIFGCVADAAGVETLTANLHTFAATDQVLLEARLTPNVEVRFFINGVDVGALTAGLPSGVAEAWNLMYVWAENTVAADRAIVINFWEFYQAR